MTRERAAPVKPGETLAGKYLIEGVLGRGGMGIVVSARHLELHDRVAIKFLLAAPQEGEIVRFLREARTAAKVKSEHVCRVFDVGRLESGEPYLVMDYLEGVDLNDILERERPLAPSRVVGWMIEACDALAGAHALGIVHRDLKPANLFLARRADGSTAVKVLDFGISKVVGGTMADSGTIVGSPVYMSPEQVEGAPDIDLRSDVWSLGITLYELLSGEPPFHADSMIALAVKIREAMPPPLEQVNPAVPPALAAIVRRCLEKDKARRYGDVVELVAALAPFAPAESVTLVSRIVRRKGHPLPVPIPPPPPSEHELASTVAASTPFPQSGPGAPMLPALPMSARPSRKVWLALLAGLGLSGVLLAAFQAGRANVYSAPVTARVSGVSPAPSAPLVAPRSSEPTAAPVPEAAAATAVPSAARSSARGHRAPVAGAGGAARVAPPPAPSAAVGPSPNARRDLDRDDP